MSPDVEDARYEDLTDLLAARVPELREEIDAVRRWWAPDTPGQHIIYGDILNPYLVRLLEEGNDDQRLRELFAFIEELAKHHDEHIKEVVAVTILEHLGGHEALLAKARQFMGPATAALSDQIEAFWKKFHASRRQRPNP